MAVKITGANGEDQRLAWVIARWVSNKLGDSFWNDAPVLLKMKLKKRIVKGGLGLQLVVPLKYPKPGGPNMTGVTDPYAAQGHKAARGFTRYKVDCAELFMPISVPKREIKLAGSATKRLDVIETWMERNMDQWKSDYSDMIWMNEDDALAGGAENRITSLLALYNKGNGNSTGVNKPFVHPAQSTANMDGNAWTAATYGATPARNNGVAAANVIMSLGGINRDAADGSYFCCPTWTPAVAGTLGRDLINKLISAGRRGRDRMDMMLCYRDLYDATLSIVQAQQQIQPSKMVDYGFEAFSWRGVDFISDDNVPQGLGGAGTGRLIGVNSGALALHCDDEEPDVEKGPVDTERPLEEWCASAYCQLVPYIMGRGMGAQHANVNVP